MFAFDAPRRTRLLGSKNAAKAVGETVERADRIIGGHVFYRVGVAGALFQHVCGTADPMSAL